eukprot:5354317-Prymnesium_polylepis.2
MRRGRAVRVRAPGQSRTWLKGHLRAGRDPTPGASDAVATRDGGCSCGCGVRRCGAWGAFAWRGSGCWQSGCWQSRRTPQRCAPSSYTRWRARSALRIPHCEPCHTRCPAAGCGGVNRSVAETSGPDAPKQHGRRGSGRGSERLMVTKPKPPHSMTGWARNCSCDSAPPSDMPSAPPSPCGSTRTNERPRNGCRKSTTSWLVPAGATAGHGAARGA